MAVWVRTNENSSLKYLVSITCHVASNLRCIFRSHHQPTRIIHVNNDGVPLAEKAWSTLSHQYSLRKQPLPFKLN